MKRIFADHPLTSSEKNKRYYEKHRDAQLARNKAYYSKYYQTVREKRLADRRERKYGMSQEEFNAQRTQQNNRCAVCGNEFTITPCIDHNHVTKQNRGLLCSPCNALIGMAYESSEILVKAIQYLKEWNKCLTPSS
jgi:CRISPR/Cas system-associated protein Cas10 (large subunit of type III CRISPR-Cas system)